MCEKMGFGKPKEIKRIRGWYGRTRKERGRALYRLIRKWKWSKAPAKQASKPKRRLKRASSKGPAKKKPALGRGQKRSCSKKKKQYYESSDDDEEEDEEPFQYESDDEEEDEEPFQYELDDEED